MKSKNRRSKGWGTVCLLGWVWTSLWTVGAEGAEAAEPRPPARRAAAVVQARGPVVIAHRGYSKLAPENTLPAFRRGMAARADLIELDYYLNKEGEAVVLHDHTLDRTTDAKAIWGGKDHSVEARTVAELGKLDAGRWFAPAFAGTRLPTLVEALDTIQAGSTTLIERKGGDPGSLVALLRGRGELDRVVVQSFDWKFVRGCRALDRELVLGALGPPSTYRGKKLTEPEKVLNDEFVGEIRDLGANLVVWNAAVTRESVARAHESGMKVWVYTIDDPVKAKELVGLGVDGIITNDPDTIRSGLGLEKGVGAGAGLRRAIPRPLAGHPGNIYLEGEAVAIATPTNLPASATRWRMVDLEGKTVAAGDRAGKGTVELGTPSVGWYRVEWLDESGEAKQWTSLAVLARLRAPTPMDSPIGLDMAVSWFARNDPERQRVFANLAALAGANWVRDRLTWREVQTGTNSFAPAGNYDRAAEIQQAEGLRVLQVFHTTPDWAVEADGTTARFAGDLRHAYRMARELGRRWAGKVEAWEPWNEPNVSDFGGQTMDEICSWQKAAWLGFQASGAKLTVGFSALAAVPTWQQTQGVVANEVAPYCDTYNIHTYDWAAGYGALWAPARAAAQGKPLWITEADRGAKHDGRAPFYDLSPPLERLKAEYTGQSYASALAAGADRFFQFILGHYTEPSGVQFGLLRLDHTPRPAYVALAAAGRLLAGARCLGVWPLGREGRAVAFQAAPDGVPSDVVVMWCEREADWEGRGKASMPLTWPAALKPRAVYDLLGRSLGEQPPSTLTSAPVYVVLPRGQASALPVEPPPLSTGAPAAPASRVVLQAQLPASARTRVEDRPWSCGFVYSAAAGATVPVTLNAYNLGDAALEVAVTVENLPEGWTLSEREWRWRIEPMGRVTARVELKCAGPNAASDGWVALRGRHAPEPPSALAWRVMRK